jgi:Zn-dependent protease with chaperone function
MEADARAIRFTRREALASALEKMQATIPSASAPVGFEEHADDPVTAQLIDDVFATHPDIDERITSLKKGSN